MVRSELSDTQLLRAVESATVALGRKIEQSGRGALVSNHEALGCVAAQVEQLTEAVRQNDPVDVADTLMDIAATCIFAVSSMFVKEDELATAATAEQPK